MLIQVKQDKTNLPKKLHQGLPKSGLQHSNDKRDCGWHHHDPHVVYQQFFPAFLAVLLPHEDISLLQFTGLCGTLFFRLNITKMRNPYRRFAQVCECLAHLSLPGMPHPGLQRPMPLNAPLPFHGFEARMHQHKCDLAKAERISEFQFPITALMCATHITWHQYGS